MPGNIKLLLMALLIMTSNAALSQQSNTEDNTVIAIDIALEPDAVMLAHAKAANRQLLRDFPNGFSLDATHNPHVTLLQQFVLKKDLDKVYAAANSILKTAKPTMWKLDATRYYYIPNGDLGLAGIVVEPTENLRKLQNTMINAMAKYAVKNGTPSAFFSTENGKDIQKALISYVINYPTIAANDKFNPHVTIGVGTKKNLDILLAQPFEKFTFSPTGISVYQLGTFGTARKELKSLE